MINKSLLGVGLIVLLVAMTGIASANSVGYYTLTDPISDQHPPFNCGDVVVNVIVDGYNVTIDLGVADAYLTGDTKISLLGLNTDVPLTKANITSVSNYDIANITIPGPGSFGDLGNFNTIIGFKPNILGTAGPVTITFDRNIELEDNSADYMLAAHVQGLYDVNGDPNNSDASLKVGNAVCGTTEIPEFPTVALPIAAILGLSFIFMRRKE